MSIAHSICKMRKNDKYIKCRESSELSEKNNFQVEISELNPQIKYLYENRVKATKIIFFGLLKKEILIIILSNNR